MSFQGGIVIVEVEDFGNLAFLEVGKMTMVPDFQVLAMLCRIVYAHIIASGFQNIIHSSI